MEPTSPIPREIESKGVKVKVIIREGKPASEICNYASRDDVDVVLVCPHGPGGIFGWALGSVADKVARHSTKPVLVIRPFID